MEIDRQFQKDSPCLLCLQQFNKIVKSRLDDQAKIDYIMVNLGLYHDYSYRNNRMGRQLVL